MSNLLYQGADLGRDFILNEDVFQTSQLHIKVFREAPREGITWQAGYATAHLVINLGARLEDFRLSVDHRHRYHGPLVPGDFSLLPPQTDFGGQYQGDFLSYASITVLPTAMTAGLAQMAPVVMQSDSLLQGLAQALCAQRFRDDPDAVLYRDSLSEALLAHLQHTYLGSGPAAFSESFSLHRLENYIRVNLAQKITVNALANLAGVSPRTLQRAVRSQRGQSVYEWVTQLRLEYSLQLLRNSDLTLAAIAQDCGFASQSHWSRRCRQHFGRSPGQLRRHPARS